MTQAQREAKEPWWSVQDEISGVLAATDRRAWDAVLAAFGDRDRRWFFSGQGRSGLVARMAAMRFMHLGYTAHVVGETTAPAVRGGDGLLLICGSGRTPVSVAFAEIAKAEGATLVLVTREPESRLTALADVVLTIPAEGSRQFGGSLFEQCALILLDSVALSVAGNSQDAHAGMWRRHTNMQ